MKPNEYDIGVSFTGDKRDFVQAVCTELLCMGFTKDRVYYDTWHQARITGVDADTRLMNIYNNECKAVVVFLSESYKDSPWTGNIEWRSIRNLISQGKGDRICLLRFAGVDINTISGLSSTRDFATPISTMNPPQVADFICTWYKRRIGSIAVESTLCELSPHLSLSIACDGRKLVLTDQSLESLMTIDGERIEGSTTRFTDESITLDFSKIEIADLYQMCYGTTSEDAETLPDFVIDSLRQELARWRTNYEKLTRHAIAFTLNDQTLDALLGWVNSYIINQYYSSPRWKDKSHVNEYGYRQPFERALLWERVITRALSHFTNYHNKPKSAGERVGETKAIDCAYIVQDARWYFTSSINPQLMTQESLSLLFCGSWFPIDMLDLPKSDLVESVYPDLCWEIGYLRVHEPEKYNRLLRDYGSSCFAWNNLRVGLD